MGKVGIVVNGSEKSNIFPTMILGSAAAAAGDEVFIFFTPGGAPTMVKGKLEEMRDAKGLPDLVGLYDGLVSLGGHCLVCELALENKDLKKEDFRKEVELVGATTYLNLIKDAKTTFSF